MFVEEEGEEDEEEKEEEELGMEENYSLDKEDEETQHQGGVEEMGF